MTSDKQNTPLTVIMRSIMTLLCFRNFAGLDKQRGVDVTLIVFESASSDDSPNIIRKHGCAQMIELAPGTYQSARVLNEGARRAHAEYVAYINCDAVMEDDDVLLLGAGTDADDNLAGVFAQQTVRPDANSMTRLDYDLAFGNRASQKSEAAWMSMVCSMIRRSAWEEIAFDGRLTYAEDAVWSEHQIQAGRRIEYVPAAQVEHSHNYTWSERYKRSFGDRSALAVIAKERPAYTIFQEY